jgi:hypothetical protein
MTPPDTALYLRSNYSCSRKHRPTVRPHFVSKSAISRQGAKVIGVGMLFSYASTTQRGLLKLTLRDKTLDFQ